MLRDAQVVDVSAHKEKREINVTARFDKLGLFRYKGYAKPNILRLRIK